MPSRPLALVIEDTAAVRQLYVSALQLEGFTVEEAHDGQQGLEKAVALRPDIIITDVAMPVMDGREAVRRLRAGRPHAPHPDHRVQRARGWRESAGGRRAREALLAPPSSERGQATRGRRRCGVIC